MKKTLSWGVALMCASTFHASADSAEDQALVERLDSMYTALDAMPDIASSLNDIQIQRGAGTSTNGAGAFGASINMLTDYPSTERSAMVSASYGSFNSNRETVRIQSISKLLSP